MATERPAPPDAEPGQPQQPQSDEPHSAGMAGRLNWLRAGVLGANDGIVSTAGLVVGVAGATSSRATIFTAGLAGLVAGAVSMALGEYVSVCSQRDSEAALLAKERADSGTPPTRNSPSWPASTGRRGSRRRRPARSRSNSPPHDALAPTPRPNCTSTPTIWPARSMPRRRPRCPSCRRRPSAAVDPPAATAWRVPVTVVAVLAALALAGVISARIGGSSVRRRSPGSSSGGGGVWPHLRHRPPLRDGGRLTAPQNGGFCTAVAS